MRPRPFLISFLIGGIVFGVGYYMIMQRDPCVETINFQMEPNVVKPEQKFSAVWTDKTLRACDGMLNRRFIAQNGVDIWVFPPVHTVDHGLPGEVHRFHTEWSAPKAAPGAKLAFRKDFKRWGRGNFLQKWLLPMEETQEAEFTMAE